MKWCIFDVFQMKLLFAILTVLTFLLPARTVAQDKEEELLIEYQNQWNRLIPEQIKFQFAGSMGMVSLGPGWVYGKKSQWETDLFVGFIPKIDNMNGHITATLKQTYTPFRIELNDDFIYEPLTTGIYMNKIFGPYFWRKLPAKYPNNYYFWATNTRFNIFVGQAISARIGKGTSRNWSFFYEVNTNDLYLISIIGNKMIKAEDIINISFGLRYRFKE